MFVFRFCLTGVRSHMSPAYRPRDGLEFWCICSILARFWTELVLPIIGGQTSRFTRHGYQRAYLGTRQVSSVIRALCTIVFQVFRLHG